MREGWLEVAQRGFETLGAPGETETKSPTTLSWSIEQDVFRMQKYFGDTALNARLRIRRLFSRARCQLNALSP
jgi:hypothetical protein